MEDILDQYNVKVQFDIHGQPPMRDGDKIILTLPNDTSIVRDNYTIAHEIGHLVLGHSIEDMRSQYNREITDEDRQANIFAAELLMPKDLFRVVCRECRYNVYSIGDRFDVSPSAAGVRMSILNIDKHGEDNEHKIHWSYRHPIIGTIVLWALTFVGFIVEIALIPFVMVTLAGELLLEKINACHHPVKATKLLWEQVKKEMKE